MINLKLQDYCSSCTRLSIEHEKLCSGDEPVHNISCAHRAMCNEILKNYKKHNSESVETTK